MTKRIEAPIPADLQEKIRAYAELLGSTPQAVIELALRDFFHDLDAGKRPRSSSLVEPRL